VGNFPLKTPGSGVTSVTNSDPEVKIKKKIQIRISKPRSG